MILLDSITLSYNLLIVIAIIIIIILYNLFSSNSSLKRKIDEGNIFKAQVEGLLREKDGLVREKELIYKNDLEQNSLIFQNNMKEKDLQIEKMIAEAKEVAVNLAATQFEEWKTKELEAHRKVIFKASIDSAQAALAEWKISTGKELRQDAITRSMGVNFGKITEHLLPFSKHLMQFDPRDVRFIGSPVDLMIFDGATQKKGIIDIYLVEIKTGSGKLSKKQKSIRDAIEDHRVYWKPIIVPEFKWDVSDDEDNEDSGEAFAAWRQ
ncbi:MAG: Holliday junction resolvase-like protein [Ginsengibacter sp.]